MKLSKSLTIIFTLIIMFFLSACESLKPDWSKTAEPNAKKRARQNVEEGKGITAPGGLFSSKGKSTNYTFASSNPLWKASLDTLDFMVLSTVDYSGGIIISDWYSENDVNEAVKITLRFLDNEIRVDAINVIIHKKICEKENCVIQKLDTDLSMQIKDKILKKAALYAKESESENKNSIKGPKMSERDIF